MHALAYAALAASFVIATLSRPRSARADPPPAAPPSRGGVLVEVDVPGAEVRVDGTLVGRSPLKAAVPLDPGRHLVSARRDDLPKVQREVVVREGEDLPIVLRLEPLRDDFIGFNVPAESPAPRLPDARRIDAIAISGAAAAFALLGGAIALNVASNANARTANAERVLIFQAGGTNSTCAHPPSGFVAACATLRDSLSSRDAFANVALGGYALAGVAAVATVAYVFWPTPRTRAMPMVGAGTAGIALTGVF
jgi:hypothetical protein